MATAKYNREKLKIICQKTIDAIKKYRLNSLEGAISLYIEHQENRKKKSWFGSFIKVPTRDEVEQTFKEDFSIFPFCTYNLHMSKFLKTEELCVRLINMCSSEMSTEDDSITLTDIEFQVLKNWM